MTTVADDSLTSSSAVPSSADQDGRRPNGLDDTAAGKDVYYRR
jgi:hypothetical protein